MAQRIDEELDENEVMREVEATHAPDGISLAVNPLLRIIHNILQPSTPTTPGFGKETQLNLDVLDNKDSQLSYPGMFNRWSSAIYEISRKFSAEKDEHATTLEILNMLRCYEWEAKAVLVLLAFAFNYGDFLVVAQPYPTNPLVKSVPLIKSFPETQGPVDRFKPKFDAVSSLINSTLDVTKTIFYLTEFASKNIFNFDLDRLSFASSQIPISVYWTIRSILACASQILGLTGMGYDKISSTVEAMKLSSLSQKVSSKLNHLKEPIQLIDEQRYPIPYESLQRLMEKDHTDNVEILRALINTKEDELPLLKGYTETRASFNGLMGKNVLLLVSDMELSMDVVSVLEFIYDECHENETMTGSQFEMVWIPIVDRSTPWTQRKKEKFEKYQLSMPWYSVYHHSMIEPAFIKYIKEMWHFKGKPIIVVLDHQGKVVNLNAFHMILIWADRAFPFTGAREASLWEKETWGIEILGYGIPVVSDWLSEEKNIGLYGGNNIEWIRRFTAAARAVASVIPLEILYVGQSSITEQIGRNIDIISAENLSHTFPDLTQIWIFWSRIEAMLNSMKQQKGISVENDRLMKEVNTMLGFDRSNEGWALFGRRESTPVMAKGKTILMCFSKFDIWKKDIEKMGGFIDALRQHLEKLQKPI